MYETAHYTFSSSIRFIKLPKRIQLVCSLNVLLLIYYFSYYDTVVFDLSSLSFIMIEF